MRGGGRGESVPVELLESRHRLEEHGELLRVAGMVGRDPEVPARLEPLGEELQKPAIQEPPLSLPLFRPGVGEVDVERADGARRDAPRDEEGPVAPDHARVRHPRSRQPSAGESVVRERPLDSKKIVGRVFPRRLDQEPRLPGAELDLQRSPATEQLLRDERTPRPELFVGRDGEAEIPSVGQVAVLRRSDTARANSRVVALPPRSDVRIPEANVAYRAVSIRSA
jgi:hypothetical protein